MIQVDHIVNFVFTSLTWVLSICGSDCVWLVDCGDCDKIVNQLTGRKVVGVLLTHAHFDHIYGLPELLDLFPQCRVYSNEAGRVTIADVRKNMSLYHDTPVSVEGKYICLCDDKSEIPLFDGISAKVFSTPGHHSSCLSFMVGDYFFTGDAYIPGIKVVTNMPGGNKAQAQESVALIQELSKGKQICPGHIVV
ncbi:MAG: MBL fold metallo-hydrolase [Bacteroidales bacterium]|nr:MBL fold metallo-hydrolase [Bacteroidales bacterium]